VADILKITKMVAAKLLAKGLYPQGFYRAFIRRNAEARLDRTVVSLKAGVEEPMNQASETASCAFSAQEVRS
jgi:hypothetical protein